MNNPSDDDPKEPTKQTAETFKIPCELEKYTVLRKFYQIDDEEESQEMSVIQFGSKYFLSRGISIKDENDNEFSVFQNFIINFILTYIFKIHFFITLIFPPITTYKN